MGKSIVITVIMIITVIMVFKFKKNNHINPSCNKQFLKSIIENYLTEIYSRSGRAKLDIDIKSVEIIENKVEVLLTLDGVMGDAQLTKGFGNSYKIEHLSKENIFVYHVTKINDNKYLVVKGKNYDMRISKIIVTLGNKKYEFKLGSEEYFIVYCSVPKETIGEFPSNFQLFDETNHNITFDIYAKYNRSVVQ